MPIVSGGGGTFNGGTITGATTIAPSPNAIPALTVKGDSSPGAGYLVQVSDPNANVRVGIDVDTVADTGEDDTVIVFNHGADNAAGDFSQVDVDFARKGDTSGAKSSYALAAQSTSDTVGFFALQRYISVDDSTLGATNVIRADWATGNLRLGGAGGASVRDVNHAVLVGPTTVDAIIPLTVMARATQTGDLLDIIDSGANVLSRFNKGGYFITRVHAAPADGDLAAGDLAVWFDQTNAAAKLMVKAKTADGTVVAASINLA